MTEDELLRLIRVAQLRSLAEYGRETLKRDDVDQPVDKHSRRTWTKATPTFAGLEAAERKARELLADQPNFIAELERSGRERAMIYKTLVLTGLRRGELASLADTNKAINTLPGIPEQPEVQVAAADGTYGKSSDCGPGDPQQYSQQLARTATARTIARTASRWWSGRCWTTPGGRSVANYGRATPRM